MMLTHIKSVGRSMSACRSLVRCLVIFPFILLSFFLFFSTSTAHAADVTLSWDDPDNDPAVVAGYNLYYWQSGTPSTRIDVGLQSSYTLTGLLAGETYFFAVAAYDQNDNESSLSNETTVTLGIETIGGGDVTLSWDDPDNDAAVVAGYNLYYWQDGTPSSKIDVGLQSSYTVTGLVAGETYFFAVAAYDQKGNESSLSTPISVTVGASNQPPVASNGTLTVSENTVGSGKLSGSDADSDALTYRLVTAAHLGVAALTDASSGAYTYTPTPNVTGTDTFTFTVSDGQSTSGEATVTVTVTIMPVNQPPVALNGTLSTSEDTPAKGILLANNDADGGALTYHLLSHGSLGTASLTNAGTGAYTYTPNLNANGTDTLTFTASDGVYESNVATVTVTILEVNDNPVAANDSGSTNEDAGVTLAVLGNDSDPDGDAVTISSITQGANGRSVLKSGGAITYTPNTNFHGNDSFSYTISDGKGGHATGGVAVTVASVNDAPVASNGSLSASADKPVSGTLSASDVDGDALTYSLTGTGSKGKAVLDDAHSGAFTYTPDADAKGTDTLTFIANDGTVNSNTATVTLGIETIGGGDVTLSWDDPDNDAAVVAGYNLYYWQDGTPSSKIDVGLQSSYTVTGLVAGETYFFAVAAYDQKGNESSLSTPISVTVGASNQPPVASNGTLTVSENTVGSGKLSGSDADSDALTYRLVTAAHLGVAALTDASSGAYTYTPTPNVTGTDTFTFTVSDGQSTSGEATVTVTVTIMPVNQPPVALNGTLSTSEDTPAKGILLANNDADGGALTYHLLSHGSLGTASLTNAGTGAYTYTPNLNANGTDTLTFTASDGVYESNVATVTVTILEVNDNPVAANDSGSTNEDAGVTLAVLGNDSDPDGDAVTISSITQGANGRSVLKSGGAITYTPNTNFHGNDSFSYTISDGKGGHATGGVAVTVASVNDAPVASNGSLSASADKPVSGTLSASDVDGDALTYSLTGTGSKGKAVLDDAHSGAFTYTPDADAKGTDTLTFIANDGTVNSNTATVTVTIKAANDALVLEVGEISVDNAWTPVTLNKSFTEPVVIAKPMGHNGSDPAVIRIRNVTPDGFEIRVQEWAYLDGTHTAETVGYIVAERGSYTLPDGTQVEADNVNMNAASAFGAIGFQQAFDVAPVVLTAVTSVNEADAVTTRVQNVTAQGFEARMQEQEGNVQMHVAEQMAYLAWTPSAGTLDGWDFEVVRTQEVVDHTFYTVQYATTFINLPVFIGDMQTTNGTNTANLRWEHKDFYGIDIRVDEEQSSDLEIDHVPEAVGYIVFASNDTSVNADADGDGLSNVAELKTYGTDPAVADTDYDGLPDAAEVAFWNSHLTTSWDDDVDRDGLINLLDLDSDDDGLLDGEEIKLGSDPADPNSPNGPQAIALSANGWRDKGDKLVDLTWSGATGSQVRILRARNGSPEDSFIINNYGAYRDSVRRGGDYSYHVCETDGSVCSSEVGVSL